MFPMTPAHLSKTTIYSFWIKMILFETRFFFRRFYLSYWIFLSRLKTNEEATNTSVLQVVVQWIWRALRSDLIAIRFGNAKVNGGNLVRDFRDADCERSFQWAFNDPNNIISLD